MPEKAAFFHFYSASCFIPGEISGLEATSLASLPLSSAAQLGEPFFENGLLARRNAREHDAHTHVGEDEHHSAARCEGGFTVRDSDNNLCAFRRRNWHVQEASAETQVAGLGGKLCFARDFGDFGFSNNGIPRRTAALRSHSLPSSLHIRTQGTARNANPNPSLRIFQSVQSSARSFLKDFPLTITYNRCLNAVDAQHQDATAVVRAFRAAKRL